MTCILADDEEPARLLLREYISKATELVLVESFANGTQARTFLEKNSVDLAFLDINMPELSGTDLVRILEPKPLIIFTTAYSEYALEGFELDIIDYLTKPFSLERFLKAVNKANQYYQLTHDPSKKHVDYFYVKADYKIVKVSFSEVLFIEGMREYVRIYTVKKKIITLLSMTKLESELPRDRFIRVHRSSIVNLNAIDAVHNNTIEIAEHKISVGATYKDALEDRLRKKGIY